MTEEKIMWKRLMEEHPAAFEALNWGVLALSVVTFAMALGCYMAVRL